jgi:dienelactone hydrolase
VKLRVAEVVKSSMIDMWLARHTPVKVLPILHKIIDGAKEEFADVIASGGGIYCVGYCFGAKYSLLLGGNGSELQDEVPAKDDEEDQAALPTSRGPLIKVAAIAHGTQITTEDISQLKVPTCLICVDEDPLFPNEVRLAGVVELEKAALEHEVKVYPEVPHGFAVYGDYDDEKIKEAQRTAFGQMLEWLQAH